MQNADFAQIYATSIGPMRAHVNRCVDYSLPGAPQRAEDAVSQVIALAFERRAKLPRRPRKRLQWFIDQLDQELGALEDQARHEEQTTRRLPRDDLLHANDRVDIDVAFAARAQAVATWANLQPQEHEALTLLAVTQLTTAEMAKTLGVSYTHFTTIINRLRSRLAALESNEPAAGEEA